MIVRFDGESNWDSIINHFSLDIDEEYDFENFIMENGETRDSNLEILEQLYEEWETTR